MSNLMLAKNYETNRNVAIHSDRHGILWDKLRHERADARCYIAQAERYINTTGSVLPILTIFNTSGSTVKIGLYNIKFIVSTGGTNGYVFYFIHTLTSAPSGGSSASITNLKLGHSTIPSSIQVKQAPTTISYGTVMFKGIKHMSTSTTDTDFYYQDDFLNEIIEIPPGNGIAISASSSFDACNTYSNIRFVVIDEGDDI